MYGSIPYMIPNMGMASAPIANSLASASNLGNGLSAAKAAGTSFLGKINWASILSNTQKTLNVVNQAIPLYYQVKPVFKNLGALGRITKEFSKMGNVNSNEVNQTNNVQTETQNVINNETSDAINVNEIPNPTFFL